MKPFLAISFTEEENLYEKFLDRISANTPIDILRVNALEQKSSLDIYINDSELLSTLKLNRMDYSTILLSKTQPDSSIAKLTIEWIHSIKQPYTQINLIEKKVTFYYSETLDIHRHLYIIEKLDIQTNNMDLEFNDLTVEDIEKVTQQIAINNREELNKLLKAEAPQFLTNKFNKDLLRFDCFTDDSDQQNIIGEVVLADQLSIKNNHFPTFTFIKPYKVLLVWCNKNTSEGQLKYELKKLLKQSKSKVNEIKSARISIESEGLEEIISFLESNLIDNEIDVTFNKDTIAADILTHIGNQDWEIVSEKKSDNSRMILVNTGF
ncbi:MAG: hypothetical protein COA79_02270 [Planctomycetota bacterium]|nr:MAG: hypothetical protein COA79_02270 [Planctomycetota bacterium]